MNAQLATQAATLKVFTVNQLAAAAGVSETTARKFVKAEVEAGAATATDVKGQYAIVVEVTADDVKPTKKVYRKNPDAIRIIRKNRHTKFEFTVQSLDELAVKDPFGHKAIVEAAIGDPQVSAKWITVCLEHGTYTGSEYILDAWWKGTHPAHCKHCRKLLSADVIEAAKNLPSMKDDEDEAEADEDAA